MIVMMCPIKSTHTYATNRRLATELLSMVECPPDIIFPPHSQATIVVGDTYRGVMSDALALVRRPKIE